MDNLKNDAYWFEKIRQDLLFIENHMKTTDMEEFARSELLQDSMIFRLIQISENARRLSESYREDHTDIPWTAMYGLRNRLVHDYGNVDLGVVFDTLKNDIPELLQMLEEE